MGRRRRDDTPDTASSDTRDDSRDRKRARGRRRRSPSRSRTPPRNRDRDRDRSRTPPPARHSSSSDSETDSRDRRRSERKRAKKEKKAMKKQRRELEKQGKREGEYLAKVAKGLDKVLSSNADRKDRGRPLSLVHAGIAAILKIAVEVKADPTSREATLIPFADERLTYPRSLNYGLELLLRLGFEEVDEGGQHFFAMREKYSGIIDLVVDLLTETLVGITGKLETEHHRLRDACLGRDALERLVGGTTVSRFSSKTIGMALACLSGDVLGLPCSNWSGKHIERWFGRVTEFHALPPAVLESTVPHPYWRSAKAKDFIGCYSGDMAVAVSLAMSAVEGKQLDCKAAARRVAADASAYLQHGKQRMYTETLKVLVEKLRKGDDYRQLGMALNPSGLHGSEAPALIPFVALSVATPDSDSPPEDQALLDAIKAALLPFIVHADGIGSAFVFAHCLLYLHRLHSRDEFVPKLFIKFAWEKAALVHMSDHLRRCLRLMEDALDTTTGKIAEGYLREMQEDLEKAALVGLIGDAGGEEEETETVYTCGVAAVVGVIFAFINNIADPVQAVSEAVGLGEAAHHLGSMCGALCGALHGAEWIPLSWFSQLENGDGLSVAGSGRDRVVQIALDLAGCEAKPPKNYEEPRPHTGPSYRVSSKKDKKEKKDAAEKADAPPEAPTGTDALVAAMPISLRKYYVPK